MLNKIKSNVICITTTSFRTRQMSFVAKCLQYSEYGEPCDVLKICEVKIPDPKDNEVLVKTVAAPINPADINTIQGKYPVKPILPAVGGNEFVADVISVGKNVKNIQPGDRVVPSTTGIGTWTSYAVYPSKDLMKISNKIGIAEAATITVNPCTAYRMLKDFVQINPGDTVIQNGANSAVGQAVHQLCKAWNISSVGVVRNRPDIDNLKEYLKCLGATEVLTEEEIRKTDIFKSKLKKPKLALNCVGGKSSTEVARYLDSKGFHVTYGGMSREPVIAGTASLIFKDISYVGFWMTRWTKENLENEERTKMYSELCNLMEGGKFTAPVHEMVPLTNYKDAVTAVLNFKGFTGKKFILDFQNC
ncbi:enoyl-[acyl-carrier-protein] reductase, mitochondrial [Episyrphus balteatus]|uniref:enoyl-[acyl-carrier-protein] reductase, mitochondrial n=1 Tax=Episyrphus balteatus TaxID=286459 RepID=UPI0024862244|nr:enoyl-[acyl-carrier-protein] reductase, mitochondrial [Episyrphus balteatus]